MKLLFALALLFAVTYAANPLLQEDDEKYVMEFTQDATKDHMSYVKYTGTIPKIKNQYSISMWLNPSGTGRDMTVFDYRHPKQKKAYIMKLDKKNKIQVHANNYHTKTWKKLPDCADTHVMLVMDTIRARCLYIWLNGTRHTASGVRRWPYNGFRKGGRIVFGSGFKSDKSEDIKWNKQYVGKIANWRLYKGKLTKNQIRKVAYNKDSLDKLVIMEPSKKTMEVTGCGVKTREPKVYQPYSMVFDRDATKDRKSYVKYTGTIPKIKNQYSISMWLNPCGTGRDMTVFDYRHPDHKKAYIMKLDKKNKIHVHANNYHTKTWKKLPNYADTHVMLVMDTIRARCLYVWLNGTYHTASGVRKKPYNGFQKDGRIVFGSGFDTEASEDIKWNKQYVGKITGWKLYKGKLTKTQIKSVYKDTDRLDDLNIMEPRSTNMKKSGCDVTTSPVDDIYQYIYAEITDKIFSLNLNW